MDREERKKLMKYTEDDLLHYRVWRHVKTDSLYLVEGIATCSTNGEREGKERSVVYVSITTQTLRYRKIEEFLDGRFVPEPPRSPPPKGSSTTPSPGSEQEDRG